MKKYIRTTLLIVAIYSGAIAASSDDVNIVAAAICGVACGVLAIINDDNK